MTDREERFVAEFVEGNLERWQERARDSRLDHRSIENEVRRFYEHAISSKASCPIYMTGWTAALSAIAGAFKKILTRDSLMSLCEAIGAAKCGEVMTPTATVSRED